MLSKIFILLFVSLHVFADLTKERAPENRLHRHLLNNYNPSVRPVSQSGTPIIAKLKFILLAITDLDTDSQVIDLNGWISSIWRDEFLQWNSRDFNDQTSIRLSPEDIWTPEVQLLNGKSEGVDRETNVLAYNNGSVIWIVPKDFRANCEVNLRFFPFDKHTCSLKFGSWVYNGQQVDFENVSTTVDLSLYRSGQWKVASSNVAKALTYYECCPNTPYPSMSFEISVERKCSSYFLSIILPLIILSVFSLLIFLFPLESIARLAFALLVLVGFLAVLIYIQTSVAGSSSNVPLISVYCVVMAVIVAIAILLIILLINFNSKYGRMPDILRNTIFKSCVQNCASSEASDANKIPNEWKSVASCLDLLFFYLFSLIIILFIIVFIIVFAAL